MLCANTLWYITFFSFSNKNMPGDVIFYLWLFPEIQFSHHWCSFHLCSKFPNVIFKFSVFEIRICFSLKKRCFLKYFFWSDLINWPASLNYSLYSNDIQNRNGNGGPLLSDGMSIFYPDIASQVNSLSISALSRLWILEFWNTWILLISPTQNPPNGQSCDFLIKVATFGQNCVSFWWYVYLPFFHAPADMPSPISSEWSIWALSMQDTHSLHPLFWPISIPALM